MDKITMMKTMITAAACAALLGGCKIYRSYERPDALPADSLYRTAAAAAGTQTIADMPWNEVFADAKLQRLIDLGLSNNTDMPTALLRTEQARAQLRAAKLSFLPSASFSPNVSLSKSEGSDALKTYELPLAASWQIDLFGSLRNAKREAQMTLLAQEAYAQAVRSQLVATIAGTYYSLLMTDEQVNISASTLEIWEEQVRTMSARLRVGEETQNAVSQARASLYNALGGGAR